MLQTVKYPVGRWVLITSIKAKHNRNKSQITREQRVTKQVQRAVPVLQDYTRLIELTKLHLHMQRNNDISSITIRQNIRPVQDIEVYCGHVISGL